MASPPPAPPSTRQLLSCTTCHKRKVKCDRVKPCRACCLRGTPEQCQFNGNVNVLSQAEEIRRLRKKVVLLEEQLRLSTSQALRSGPRELIAKPNHSKLPLVPKQYSVSVKHNTEGSTPPTIDEALISHFIETVCPSPSECLRVWVRFLAERSRQSPMLWNALSALSYLSHARNDPSDSLLFQSQRRYTATIRLLRGELAMVNGHNAPGALDTMTLLSIYEMKSFQNPLSWLLHIDGAATFLQQRGSSMFIGQVSQHSFDIFRLLEVLIKVVRRRRTFLADKGWQSTELNVPQYQRSPLTCLIDIITKLPGLLEEADSLERDMHSPVPIAEKVARQTSLWAQIDQMDAALTDWRRVNGVSTSPIPKQGELPSGTGTESPGKDALAVCINLACRLILSRIDTRPWRPPAEDLIQKATALCGLAAQSTRGRTDFMSILILLFTLRPAYYTFPPTHPGRQAIQGMFANFSATYQLPVAANIITMFPPPGPVDPAP